MNGFLKSLAVAMVSLASLGAHGGAGEPGGGEGRLTLRITDAPVDFASRAVVQFAGVEVSGDDGTTIRVTFDTPQRIDLLSLRDGLSAALLDGVAMPAGRYHRIRLMLNAGQEATDSYLQLDDGAIHPLALLNGSQADLTLAAGFVIPPDGKADLTLDFDLRKSIHRPARAGAGYILKPALRLVDNRQVGAITGTVAAARLNAPGCSAAVYVYAGHPVTPDDEGSAGAPITTAPVTLDHATGDYRYRATFLSPGPYTAAFTCQAAVDEPTADQAIAFADPVAVDVRHGQAATANF